MADEEDSGNDETIEALGVRDPRTSAELARVLADGTVLDPLTTNQAIELAKVYASLAIAEAIERSSSEQRRSRPTEPRSGGQGQKGAAGRG